MKIKYIARQGKNGFIVVTDKGSYTYRTSSKDEEVEEITLEIVNATNSEASRAARREARKP